MPHTLPTTPGPATPRVTVALDHFPGVAEVKIFDSAGTLVVKQIVRQDYLDCDFVRRCEDWIAAKEAERAAARRDEPAPPAPRLVVL